MEFTGAEVWVGSVVKHIAVGTRSLGFDSRAGQI